MLNRCWFEFYLKKTKITKRKQTANCFPVSISIALYTVLNAPRPVKIDQKRKENKNKWEQTNGNQTTYFLCQLQTDFLHNYVMSTNKLKNFTIYIFIFLTKNSGSLNKLNSFYAGAVSVFMSSIEYSAVCCTSCGTFQSHRRTKVSKFSCPVCGTKQSIIKTFSVSYNAK